MQLLATIKHLPSSPGVYKFFDQNGQLIYVGKSVSLKNRVMSYFKNANLGPKTNLMVKKTAKVGYIKVFSEFEALLLESDLIKRYQPFFNTIAKDDKSPLYIKITGGFVPLVSTCRREKPKRGLFLKGPFPSAKTAREILRMIRRIFPYCHHKKARKPCLYVHLGLCPFPLQSEEKRLVYCKTIEKLKKLLSGKTTIVIRQLTTEMQQFSGNEKFEEAQKVKEQIAKIQALTTTYHAPEEFLAQPTLVDDLIKQRLIDLKGKLNLADEPQRIECYDISNLFGKLATGAMAVFINGQSDNSQYRRFKIKFQKVPNDYQMIKEVLIRRLRNDWPKPDLIVIDGGRGHLNMALSVLTMFKQTIAVVALAKKYEQIYVPSHLLPIALPKESPARQLLEAIRDEAHRLAISYHRLLRQKAMLSKIKG